MREEPKPGQAPLSRDIEYVSPMGQIHTFRPDGTPVPQPPVPERPKPRRNWRRLLVVTASLVALCGVLYGIYLALTLLRVSANPFGFGKLKGESDGRVNVLLLGVGDEGHEGGNLSDTNIVMSVNTNTNQVAMISIPRDTKVYIPGHGYAKINEANVDGGYQLAEKTVSQTLGIPIHYYAQANFTGLKELVDAVGGIDVNVTERLYDPEYPCDNNEGKSCGLLIKPGQQHMDGALALKYARCRKGTCGNDFGRAARQQEVLQKVREKATGLGVIANPVSVGKLVNALGNNIKTDLSLNNMMRLNDFSKKVGNEGILHIVFSTQPNGFLIDDPAGSYLLPADGDFSDIQKFVADVFSVGPLWEEGAMISVQNGTTTVGLAGTLGDAIEKQQPYVTVGAVTNATKRDYATTQIIDYSNGKVPRTVAYLQNLLHVTATKPEKALANPVYDVVVIVGSDYAATVTQKSSQTSAQ